MKVDVRLCEPVSCSDRLQDAATPRDNSSKVVPASSCTFLDCPVSLVVVMGGVRGKVVVCGF